MSDEDKYKIVIVDRDGKKYQLSKVGAPDFLMMESEIFRPLLLLDYAFNMYRDKLESKDNVKQISYKYGRKNIMNYKY